jgi:metal-dependent amidase/aminoacylase/carboxypeptidase family protein
MNAGQRMWEEASCNMNKNEIIADMMNVSYETTMKPECYIKTYRDYDNNSSDRIDLINWMMDDNKHIWTWENFVRYWIVNKMCISDHPRMLASDDVAYFMKMIYNDLTNVAAEWALTEARDER